MFQNTNHKESAIEITTHDTIVRWMDFLNSGSKIIQYYCRFLPLHWSKHCHTYTFKAIHILAIVDSGTPLVHTFVPNYESIPINFLQELSVA